MIEQRRYARSPLNSPLHFAVKGDPEPRQGIGRDIALGGMFIETDAPGVFGQNVSVQLRLPGSDKVFTLPAIVRWVSADGMGVQFGMIGVIETHLITEHGRRHGR